MFTEEEFIIYVYCLIDEYLPKVCPEPLRHAGFLPQFSDAEALTLEIVGEYLGLETDKQLYRYFRKHLPGMVYTVARPEHAGAAMAESLAGQGRLVATSGL